MSLSSTIFDLDLGWNRIEWSVNNYSISNKHATAIYVFNFVLYLYIAYSLRQCPILNYIISFKIKLSNSKSTRMSRCERASRWNEAAAGIPATRVFRRERDICCWSSINPSEHEFRVKQTTSMLDLSSAHKIVGAEAPCDALCSLQSYRLFTFIENIANSFLTFLKV